MAFGGASPVPSSRKTNGGSPRDGPSRAAETAPLLGRQHGENDSADSNTMIGDQDDGQASKSVWYLILLTISLGGLQIAWSVELSNGSPYLLSLGLSKSLMALVWIAGPLTGTLVQPYVGMLSDNCRLPMGKRKPFMLGGALATILSLLFLAWTREIVGGFLSLFGADPESHPVKIAIICAAVIGVYVLDFAINTVQAAIRAFIVDCAPSHQQEAANAMASRIVGFGNIIGYCAGYIDLPRYIWFLGNTEFKDLCALASIALGSTVLLSTSFIKERDPRLDGPAARNKPGVLTFFLNIFTSIKRLPPQIKRVCKVQFFAWIGFFPLLFYTSSYISELYVEPYLRANPNMSKEELDNLYEEGTRVGTFALLVNSVVSLLTNVFLPFFIAPTYDNQPAGANVHGDYDASSDDDNDPKPSILDYLRIPGFTLKRAWLLSLIIFSISMFCTVLVRTVETATALVGLVGITWAMTLWAPWAIISAEISRRDALLRAKRQRHASSVLHHDAESTPILAGQDADPHEGSAIVDDDEEETDQAGVILGIHNMAIAAPQIIATVASSIIFRLWQKPRGTPGDHSIAIVFALGGFTVLIASYFVARIQDDAAMPADAMIVAEEARDIPSRPGTARSRRPSYEQLPRASQQRATLTRSKSFGGMEY